MIIAILTMSSIFVSVINTHDLPIKHTVLVSEVFAALGTAWVVIKLTISDEWRSRLFLTIFLMELLMMAFYIYIAVEYGASIGSCSSYADTPFGNVKGVVGLPSVGDSCEMQMGIFALSIVTA